jgi:site-specific recombinase XerD
MFTDFPEYEEYMKKLEIDKSEHTIRSYKKSIVDFFEYFSVASLDDLKKIDAKQVRTYQSYLLDSGMKASSINANFRPISAFLNWLKNQDYIENVITNKIDNLKEPKIVPFILTDEEISAMINTETDIQNKLMLMLMFTTAIRRNELVNIRIEDIGIGKILINKGKGDKQREVPIHPKVQILLDEYLKRNKNEYLFVSHRGSHQLTPQSVMDRMKDAAIKANLDPERIKKISPHKARHSAISTWLNNGTDLITISQISGHASLGILKRYAHPSDQHMAEAVNNMKGLGD